jgi:hypothetical protein
MTQGSGRSVFVTATQGELEGDAARLIHLVEDAGISVAWSLIGESPIEEAAPVISGCSGLLAFETGSTYHSMEVSFALGDASWRGDGRPLQGRPLPVFAYSDGSEEVRDWIWRDPRIVRLPRDPPAAVATFLRELADGT